MTTNVNVNTAGGGTGATRDMTGRKVIAALFTDRADAEKAINALRDGGFRPEDVGVAMRDRTEQGELIEDTGTRAAAGAGTGALGGGVLGGIVGFLVGVGALAIPGIGPVVAGGMLASAFGLAGGTAVAGAGIGAAAGGILGALVGMGIPEDEAKHFESGFREGGVLLTVNAGQRAMEALAILERAGGDTGPGSMGAQARMGGASRSGGAEVGGGAVAGGLAGAAAGTAIGGPVGTVIGGVAGAATGATAGKAVQESRDPAHRDAADEGTAGGGLAGGTAGAAVGAAVAGPLGILPGAAIGGTVGAATGATAGATQPDDDDEWMTDAQGNRVRRPRTNP
ncbi:MAG: hypothetical protein M3442_05060 [Chloroflexota bacterium]|nr:hypothetical protein [Chloroflexota bacterium]